MIEIRRLALTQLPLLADFEIGGSKERESKMEEVFAGRGGVAGGQVSGKNFREFVAKRSPRGAPP